MGADVLNLTSTRPPDVRINLALPPSVNAIWKPGGGRAFKKSDAYKQWLTAAGWEVLSARAKPIPGRFHLLLTLGQQRADIDNRLKPICDVLQAQRVISNDRHMQRVAIQVRPELVAPDRCEIMLWSASDADVS